MIINSCVFHNSSVVLLVGFSRVIGLPLGYPYSSIIDGIFSNKNHPAFLGIPMKTGIFIGKIRDGPSFSAYHVPIIDVIELTMVEKVTNETIATTIPWNAHRDGNTRFVGYVVEFIGYVSYFFSGCVS